MGLVFGAMTAGQASAAAPDAVAAKESFKLMDAANLQLATDCKLRKALSE